MTNSESVKKKNRTIRLNVDLNATPRGFESAKSPTAAHRRIMKTFSSALLLGPPMSETLLEMVTHLFTEDEADVARCLLPLLPLTAKQIARLRNRPPGEVSALLENLAENKHVILSFGSPKKYTVLPLVPGTFEMAIVSPDLARNNLWHKRFAELFEKVWDTEYIRDYVVPMAPPVRYIPAQSQASRLQTAWPADRLEEILEPYSLFGMAHCQCRVVTSLAGKGCGKPTENCVAIGPLAQPLIDRGYLRKADRGEVIEAKRIAEENGCVTWMMNGMNSKQGNYSCSCCGCCCHALRTITQFNMPGLFSDPHDRPGLDAGACNNCGACVRACPMGAWKISGGALHYDSPRCIGCGLCVSACKLNALELSAAPGAKNPDSGAGALMLKILPVFAANSFRVWARRAAGI